jgi:CRISPR-associated endoribonuclease Cas6
MPTALMLTLRPEREFEAPANLGRAAHAAILRLIDAASPELARQLHDDIGVKPLTVSNVLGLRGGRVRDLVGSDQTYGLRVTLLTAELEELALAWTPERLGTLDLDGRPWQVERAAADPAEHPWAGRSSYGDLAAPALARGESATRWTIEFAAPVTFRQRGLNQPLPSPDLVFGSLLDKWNAFAPIALPEEVRRFASECMATSRFELRSLAEPTKGGATQIGAVGRCTYVATNRDRYWCACVETLARFAFWSGVGAGATRGFGRARLIE